ncbi:matrixin family metalloprotease [Lederbergia sp. NSJ-179]|uniref:matrixin family metalloprotease n=1 Tax=Lederbergia sp. NSJ-179 TaxID=2931402 RepID=UPI001FD02666|nr:matrixin family metalloprotease [Lederbergia sp. NSJ-179]MCJ7840118.1 matrixin family metalloprotease [Lederbergia sp. NSJ-179]
MKLSKLLIVLAIVFLSLGITSNNADAATGKNGKQWSSPIINYYNDGTNSAYQGFWNTAKSRWNASNHVLMGNGSGRDFRAGNKNAGKVSWDGTAEYSWNSSNNFTRMRTWLNTYYTTQSKYTTDIINGVATHEFGHALGLAHNDRTSSVMMSATFYTDGTLARKHQSPTSEDTSTIKNIYGTLGTLSIHEEQELIEQDARLSMSKNFVILEPSYSVGYRSIEEIVSTADLIVEGTVTEKSDLKKADPEDFVTYRTERSVFVKDVLKGDKSLENQEIIFDQLGGSDSFATVISDESTPLEEGSKVILLFEKEENGSYSLINDNSSIFVDELKNGEFKYLKDSEKLTEKTLKGKMK